MAQPTITRRLWQYFLTGLFVLIPAGLTIFIAVWLVRSVDLIFQFGIPGEGIVFTIALLTLLGFIMSSVVGQRLYQMFEGGFLHIPGVGAFYKTVKSLTNVFSPNSQSSFRHVVLVEYPYPGALALGFVTSEFETSEAGGLTEKKSAVYIPTNNLYIGTTIVVPSSRLKVTALSVPEAVQVVLSGGANFPATVSLKNGEKP